ncbi:unnamed protein product, partial [Iphiclides podalirius]
MQLPPLSDKACDTHAILRNLGNVRERDDMRLPGEHKESYRRGEFWKLAAREKEWTPTKFPPTIKGDVKAYRLSARPPPS